MFWVSVVYRAACQEGTSWSNAKTKVLENESVYLFTICHAHWTCVGLFSSINCLARPLFPQTPLTPSHQLWVIVLFVDWNGAREFLNNFS